MKITNSDPDTNAIFTLTHLMKYHSERYTQNNDVSDLLIFLSSRFKIKGFITTLSRNNYFSTTTTIYSLYVKDNNKIIISYNGLYFITFSDELPDVMAVYSRPAIHSTFHEDYRIGDWRPLTVDDAGRTLVYKNTYLDKNGGASCAIFNNGKICRAMPFDVKNLYSYWHCDLEYFPKDLWNVRGNSPIPDMYKYNPINNTYEFCPMNNTFPISMSGYVIYCKTLRICEICYYVCMINNNGIYYILLKDLTNDKPVKIVQFPIKSTNDTHFHKCYAESCYNGMIYVVVNSSNTTRDLYCIDIINTYTNDTITLEKVASWPISWLQTYEMVPISRGYVVATLLRNEDGSEYGSGRGSEEGNIIELIVFKGTWSLDTSYSYKIKKPVRIPGYNNCNYIGHRNERNAPEVLITEKDAILEVIIADRYTHVLYCKIPIPYINIPPLI